MRGPAAFLLVATLPSGAAAATLVIELRDARGAPIEEAVAWAVPEGRKPPRSSRTAVMDQRNRTFIPHVLAIQAGTAVRFPNSDNVRHQVYSFSPAKRFQLPLYEGTPSEPVVFETPGVVALGCNIHDNMSAYIVVVDTPYFAGLQGGRAELADLPEGSYTAHVWSPDLRPEPAPRAVVLGATDRKELVFAPERK